MLSITQMLLTNHNRPKKPLKKLKAIVLHWTANTSKGADAVANRNYFNSTGKAASAHYIVDDKTIIQCVPDNELAYHCGDKKYTSIGNSLKESPYSPNFFTIGIEMCVNSDGNFNKMYQNTVELVAYLLKKYNLTINDILTHHKITGKDCPQFMQTDVELNKFRNEVQKLLIPTPQIIIYPNPKKAKLITDNTVCKLEPSNNSKTNGILKLGKHDNLTIYGECKNEGYTWLLINNGTVKQWIVSRFVKIIEDLASAFS